jgi:serine/threonine protein kinase
LTPERWRHVLEVFDAALQHEQSERRSFVVEVCAEDEELARAVHSLLLANDHATGFAGAPIMSAGSALAVADVFGPYRIDAFLGRGGMGEVYQARDTTLNRDVALKILPFTVSLDFDRVARFKREAQLLASLNHPNIAAIYGFVEHDGIQALVMELVPGSTLAERIARRSIRWQEAVIIAKQIAEALDAAHHLAIVHRDLKPANVKVLPDSTVKVLDFGLAIPMVAAGTSVARPLMTADAAFDSTHDGILAGTPAYMSPEQALGQAVDQRTDVWAFGCVLFEMLAGYPVFARSTIADTLRAVVQDEPDWARLPRVPAPLGRLLEKCLARDPRRRLRSIADSLFDLEEASGSAAEAVVPKRRKRVVWASAAASVCVVGAIAAALFRQSDDMPGAAANPQLLPVTTYRGFEGSPSISPDGSHVAFVWNGEKQDNPDIYVTGLPSGPTVRLTNTNPQREDLPVWSPDGNEIAFVRGVQPPVGEVVVVSLLGGAERVLAEDVRPGTLDWSSDGRWLLYSAARVEAVGLWVQSKATGERHHLAGTTERDRSAQFSPNGHSVAFIRMHFQDARSDVYVVSLDAQMRTAGEPRRLTSDSRNHGTPRWVSDSELVFTTGIFGTGSIDRMSISVGKPQRVMTIDGIGGGIDVSPATGRLLLSQNTGDVDIHLVELSAEGTAGHLAGPVITSSGNDVFPVYSPDGERIAFASTRSGEWQIWSSDRDGSNAVQLTKLQNAEAWPVAWKPPSGQQRHQLGFLHNSDGDGMRAYTVDAAGGPARPVPELERVKSAIRSFWWSPDGGWIVYSTPEGVWKVATGDVTPVKLDLRNFFPSSDGPTFGGYDPTSATWRIVSLDTSPERSIDLPAVFYSPDLFRVAGIPPTSEGNPRRIQGMGGWMGLRVSSYGPSGVYLWMSTSQRPITNRTVLTFFPLNSGDVFPIVDATSVSGFGQSLAPNGRSLLYSHIVSDGSDLVLLDNFK